MGRIIRPFYLHSFHNILIFKGSTIGTFYALLEASGMGPTGMEQRMNNISPTLICLACYEDRLATVCENADEYRLFEIREGKIYPAGHLSLPSKDPMDRTSAILACGVSFLVCGAVCADFRFRMEHGGITVIPWITGKVEIVLDAFCCSTLHELTMPGSPDMDKLKSPPVDSAI